MKLKFNKLAENITSLVSLKGAEYILNFILFPYLVRTLGVERFGAIVFMQGIVQYGIILVDYGFNLTGPRDIARAIGKEQIGQLFSDIMGSKCILFFMVTLCSLIGIQVAHYLGYEFDAALYWSVYLLVLGNLIFPIWFFQGIQQMRYITVFNVLARSITVLLVFLFVKKPGDYLLAALFQSGTLLLAGVFSLFILQKDFSYVFVKPTAKGIKQAFYDGWHVYLSTIAINIYTTTNTVVLGAMTNNTVVGYFGTANKLIDCIKGVMFTFNQAVYPYVSNKLREGKEKTLQFLKKYSMLYCGGSFVGGILLLGIAPIIIQILFGKGYNESVFILRLMAFLPFIISISNVFGIQIMLNFGYQKIFSRILVMAAIFDLLLVFPMVNLLSGVGVALTMILVEAFVTICTTFYVIKIKKVFE